MCIQVPCVYLLSAASTVIRNSPFKPVKLSSTTTKLKPVTALNLPYRVYIYIYIYWIPPTPPNGDRKKEGNMKSKRRKYGRKGRGGKSNLESKCAKFMQNRGGKTSTSLANCRLFASNGTYMVFSIRYRLKLRRDVFRIY